MNKLRMATALLSGCSGCQMSLLNLDDSLFDLAKRVDLVYSPIHDTKEYPDNVEVAFVEGAIADQKDLEMARTIRKRTRCLVSFGDCAVTGSATSLRNPLPVRDLLSGVFPDRPGEETSETGAAGILPKLLAKVLPLHQVVKVDVFLPGCPPGSERINRVLTALGNREPVELDPDMRRFG